MSEEISTGDMQRINNCDFYLKTKQIIKNAEVYKDLAIGEVYYIKYKNRSGKELYEIGNSASNEPTKYIIFHKDEDFVFVKRIIASGKMGKEITCLTTTYDTTKFWLEPDPDYVNSILLSDEGGYDPMAATKKLSSNKNKARRRNKKLEVKFTDNQSAYDFIDGFKIGDKIYDANTSYGSNILTWEVTSIEKRLTNRDKPVNNYYRSNAIGSTEEDQLHNRHGFKDLVAVTFEVKGNLPDARRYTDTKKIMTFDNFTSRYSTYYKSKPYTVDDV